MNYCTFCGVDRLLRLHFTDCGGLKFVKDDGTRYCGDCGVRLAPDEMGRIYHIPKCGSGLGKPPKGRKEAV